MYKYILNQSPRVLASMKAEKILKASNLKTCGSKSDNTKIMKLACSGNIKHWAPDVNKRKRITTFDVYVLMFQRTGKSNIPYYSVVNFMTYS